MGIHDLVTEWEWVPPGYLQKWCYYGLIIAALFVLSIDWFSCILLELGCGMVNYTNGARDP